MLHNIDLYHHNNMNRGITDTIEGIFNECCGIYDIHQFARNLANISFKNRKITNSPLENLSPKTWPDYRHFTKNCRDKIRPY